MFIAGSRAKLASPQLSCVFSPLIILKCFPPLLSKSTSVASIRPGRAKKLGSAPPTVEPGLVARPEQSLLPVTASRSTLPASRGKPLMHAARQACNGPLTDGAIALGLLGVVACSDPQRRNSFEHFRN